MGINPTQSEIEEANNCVKHTHANSKTSKVGNRANNIEYNKSTMKLGDCLNVNNTPARGTKVLMYSLVSKYEKFYCSDLDTLNKLKDKCQSYSSPLGPTEYTLLIPGENLFHDINYCTDNNTELWIRHQGKYDIVDINRY